MLLVSRNVYAASFERAALKVGGVAPLAALLDMPVGTVEQWVHGTAHPPVSVFLRVVDLIFPLNG